MPELVVESLVVSLTMVVLDVLVDDEVHMPLAERDDTMEALLFDRPDEPLGRGVEIRAFRWQPDWLNIATRQDRAKAPRVEGIAVMHQLARGPQEAVDRVGQIAGQLLQPPAIGLRVEPGAVPPAGRQLDHDEDDIPPRRCCMNTLWGWGGLARTSPDAVLPVAPAAGGGPLNGRLAGSYRPNIP